MTQRKIFSIVIRVRNAEKDLQRCLNLLQQQHLPEDVELEIVVVDNESTDRSAAVALAHGAKIIFLPVNEFSWGRALNRGIAASSGEIILLLSTDAHPADNNWFVEMVAPLEEPDVVAVYGRQIPRADAPIDEIVRLKKSFPERNIKFDINSLKSPKEIIIASNACAAFRRKIWEYYLFNEMVDGAEEQLWIRQVIGAEYKSVYRSSAVVFHSHKDTLLRNACRLVELWKESSAKRNRAFGLRIFIRSLLSYAKKRLLNIVFPDIPAWKRFEGTVRLPFEMTAMLVVFFALHTGLFKKLRYYAWK